MRIITISCSNCGTVVSGNELETERVMHCPGLGCDTILAFTDLPTADQEYLTE